MPHIPFSSSLNLPGKRYLTRFSNNSRSIIRGLRIWFFLFLFYNGTVKNVNGQKREGSKTRTDERNRNEKDREQNGNGKDKRPKVNCFEWKDCILSNKSKSLKKCLIM